jgi:hypothetical protein
MISRLTSLAVVFAVMATSTIAFAAHSVLAHDTEQRVEQRIDRQPMPVVQLEPVFVHVKRGQAAPR